jgi:hypothetical protein
LELHEEHRPAAARAELIRSGRGRTCNPRDRLPFRCRMPTPYSPRAAVPAAQRRPPLCARLTIRGCRLPRGHKGMAPVTDRLGPGCGGVGARSGAAGELVLHLFYSLYFVKAAYSGAKQRLCPHSWDSGRLGASSVLQKWFSMHREI